ncbi:dihydrolipoamide acetyltransferase family protein [Cytobacillus purgationiresistens]|uniref:Dihydrolipoamide acetyltransferase component of pyruvate dehydrogenase complex n=1 Tax=Cytobacillus purgationiresistens TaxID=863449 RepID=A0ABU0ANC7_9BACI|nr:dihydrolipoamide acetyltransferase family protein [Cytobacillus purgationiresistens]MDQ0272359.1 pyruvate dehydrogenase E2 component (dihydrolipoamide acetyltransferase) [Cytobacillus purgationiresistens]
MIEVTMPKAGLSMTEGLIQEWCVKEGEAIEKGDPLLVIETEKSALEVEAPASGVLKKITVQAGENVPVNATIAWIGETGAEAEEVKTIPMIHIDTTERADEEHQSRFAFRSEQRREPFLKASPAARRLAREHQIDLQTVKGSGPLNRIIQKDVQAQVQSRAQGQAQNQTPNGVLQQVSAPVDASQHLSGIRKVIAKRMSKSARTIPHVTINTKIDVFPLQKFRKEILDDVRRQNGESISYTHLLIKIVARALQEHQNLNASLSEEGYIQHKEIHIGMAVDTERGLVVPVIKNASQLSLTEIAKRSKVLAEKAKAGTLTPDEITGGTFTISNLGSFGIDEFTPIINYPEAALLGVGRILQLPWVVEGTIVPRPILTLSLSFDHRIIDGAPAAKFLQTISRYVESPYLLV